MSHRCLAGVLILAMLGTGSQIQAQELVSPKLLPPAATLRMGITARNLAFDQADGTSNQTAPHRHWSKTGKILTIVGAGLIGAGTAALVHGQNSEVACNGGSCVNIAWRATGAIWMGAGAALVIVGATRRTED
jgi:hypothetical protein